MKKILKPASMPSSRKANSKLRSGLILRRVLLGLLLFAAVTAAQTQKPASKKAAAPTRANELTLAGLRPGVDKIAKAKTRFGTKDMSIENGAVSWTCAVWKVTVDLGDREVIRSVILQENPSYVEEPPSNKITEHPLPCYLKISASGIQLEQGMGFEYKNLWTTGKGMNLGDSTERLLRTYGKPDSLSPSTRDGQPLELWYYAFDWAGPDVPQVMEVLCTKEKDGNPGKVIEITLAAPSL